MIYYLRARGIVWSLPAAVAMVLLGAWFGNWLGSRENFDHVARVPAVVFGALGAAVLAAPGFHHVDDELEGSVPRPRPSVELLATLVLVAICAAVAVVTLPLFPYERGGMEFARNIIGLSGIALLGGAIAGSRLAWVLPFVWAVGSYFSVTRVYWARPSLAAPGWLLFPATYEATWVVAFVLFGAGLAAFAWGGFVPRPRLHPLR